MTRSLESIARDIVAPGKGILAADESTGTMGKRLASIGVGNEEERRLAYRNMLFTTRGMADFISGVILYDETIRQKSTDGTPIPQLLDSNGVLPGIKVDTGAKALAGAPGEKITEGLDGLRPRLSEYRELGARFAKWRAVITIGENMPSDYCIAANAHALGRYAALCQEAGLVPIVEPEVLMDGPHTLERCAEVTGRTLHAVYDELHVQRVHLEGTLLKPNMVISGTEAHTPATIRQVAEATIECLARHVPAAVPGIVFLSGGQSDEVATAHLDAMNRMGPQPWSLSFSYGRALQAAALKTWGGNDDLFGAAQRAFYHRARCNGAACLGKYDAQLERATI